MKILAIDPGPLQSAYVIWDGTRKCGAQIMDNESMAELIAGAGVSHDFDYIAIEKIACYGMAVGAEVFETCVWTGRFMEVWIAARRALYGGKRRYSEPLRIPRGEIKVHLCRSTRAKDANVRQALIDRFGKPGTKSAQGPLYGVTSHCWAALAVAVCAHDRLSVGIGE